MDLLHLFDNRTLARLSSTWNKEWKNHQSHYLTYVIGVTFLVDFIFKLIYYHQCTCANLNTSNYMWINTDIKCGFRFQFYSLYPDSKTLKKAEIQSQHVCSFNVIVNMGVNMTGLLIMSTTNIGWRVALLLLSHTVRSMLICNCSAPQEVMGALSLTVNIPQGNIRRTHIF